MRFKILLSIIMILFCSVNCFGFPKAKLTVKVIDTEGNPVVGAYSFANFYDGSESNIVRGETDNDGVFTAMGETIGVCGITIRKEGYYSGGGAPGHKLKRGKGLFSNRWEPWDKIDTVVLKDIRNPTQMYAKNTDRLDIPILDEPVGYDLEVGDWVLPYGKGVIKDFIFIFQKSDKNAKLGLGNWRISYKLIFSNEKDGIQEYYSDKEDYSQYKWPYKAPETDYLSNIEGFISINGGYVKKSFDKKRNYIFRVRTKLDKKGKIIDARYGKIREDFRIGLDWESLGVITFIYYFNPTGKRNLEYDVKNPLFKFDQYNMVKDGFGSITLGP